MGLQELSFRPASLLDADAIRILTRAAYAKWVPLIGREPLPMAADYEKSVRSHEFILAHHVGGLAGLIELVPGESHVLIENLAVHPDWQGRGLGCMLLALVEREAACRGWQVVKLYTNSKFEENIRFYRKHGFSETGRDMMVPGSITVHMAKHLAKSL